MKALERWWGSNVMAIALWQAETNRDLIQHQGPPLRDRRSRSTYLQETSTREQREQWKTIHSGGMDGLHLIHHAESPVWEPRADWERGTQDAISLTTGAKHSAVLMLDVYDGWYRVLGEVGASLQADSPQMHEHIEVVVRPIGLLGRFRRSPNTGIWHSVTEQQHLLGWP